MNLALVISLIVIIGGISYTIYTFGRKHAERKREIEIATARAEGAVLRSNFSDKVREIGDETRKAEDNIGAIANSDSAILRLLRPNGADSDSAET